MELFCAGVSDVGRTRSANEDFFATDLERGLFVVADGLGGHVAGRVASETAVQVFMRVAGHTNHPDPLAELRASARMANAAILQHAASDPDLGGMATTMAALWLRERSAVLAHLGDSRIYLRREGVLHALTMDHSYVCELVFRRRLDAESARQHPNRHVIMRALGVAPPAEPDLCTLEVRSGDVFLLCTDGVHNQLSDAQINAAVESTGADLEAAARRLIELANESGGYDNATALLVRAF